MTEPVRNFDEGVICDAENHPDYDWFRFVVPEASEGGRSWISDRAMTLKLFDAQQGAIEQSLTTYADG